MRVSTGRLSLRRGRGCRRRKKGQGWWDTELHRLEGIALVGLNRMDEGQSSLEAALRGARRQQAKSYELRAATSLARLWGEQGRRPEACDLVAPVYSWFYRRLRHRRPEGGEDTTRSVGVSC